MGVEIAHTRTSVGRLELWADADLEDPDHEVVQFQRLRRIQDDVERDALRDVDGRGTCSFEAIDLVRGAVDSEEVALDVVDGRLREG